MNNKPVPVRYLGFTVAVFLLVSGSLLWRSGAWRFVGEFVLNPDTEEPRPMKSKGLDRLGKDDLVSLRMPGAGGYGDPGKRDRDQLLRDVRDGKVSVETAQRDYGVTVTDEMLSDLD